MGDSQQAKDRRAGRLGGATRSVLVQSHPVQPLRPRPAIGRVSRMQGVYMSTSKSWRHCLWMAPLSFALALPEAGAQSGSESLQIEEVVVSDSHGNGESRHGEAGVKIGNKSALGGDPFSEDAHDAGGDAKKGEVEGEKHPKSRSASRLSVLIVHPCIELASLTTPSCCVMDLARREARIEFLSRPLLSCDSSR